MNILSLVSRCDAELQSHHRFYNLWSPVAVWNGVQNKWLCRPLPAHIVESMSSLCLGRVYEYCIESPMCVLVQFYILHCKCERLTSSVKHFHILQLKVKLISSFIIINFFWNRRLLMNVTQRTTLLFQFYQSSKKSCCHTAMLLLPSFCICVSIILEVLACALLCQWFFTYEIG